MSKLDLTEQHARERVGFAARAPISISTPPTLRITACCTSSDSGSRARSSPMRSCSSILQWSTRQGESPELRQRKG